VFVTGAGDDPSLRVSHFAINRSGAGLRPGTIDVQPKAGEAEQVDNRLLPIPVHMTPWDLRCRIRPGAQCETPFTHESSRDETPVTETSDEKPDA